MRTTFAGTRLQALSIISFAPFRLVSLGESVSAGHRRSARDPVGGIAAVNRDLDSYERAVLRLVPEELCERVRRHLDDARAQLFTDTESTSRCRRRPSSWRSSVQEPRPTSSGSSMCCTHCPTSDIGSRVRRLAVARTTSHEHQGGLLSGTEVVPAGDAIGRVSADTLSAYPPGIPNLMAGEVVTSAPIRRIPAGNDPCAFRTCTRWREQRHVSHPGHDLNQAIDAMTLPDSCRLPGRDVP